jgi:uncharacterized protein
MSIYKKFDPTIQQDLQSNPKKIIKLIKDSEIQNLTPIRKNETIKKDTSLTDNWSNIMTGLGQKYDKSRYSTFSGYTILDDTMLAEIWAGDGLSKKIVEAPVDDMTREWITIENDTDCLIETEFERLNVEQQINLACKWQALFGGGINVLGINDGNKLDKPVNKNRIKSIDWIRTYDRTDCSITEFHFNQDIESKDYGELQFLTIQPKYTAPFNVHTDRCLIWKGLPVPNKLETGNFYYWGISELQSCWTDISNLCSGMNHIVKILYEFIISVYGIDGLGLMIAENRKAEVDNTIAIIELAKSTIQGVLLDSKDTYNRQSASVAGLPEVIDRFMMMVSGVTEIPVSRLFGRSSAGMNATGEGDEKNYFNKIKAKQKYLLKPNLNKLIEYINISIGNKVQEPKIKFNSLFQQTEKEIKETEKLQADIDNIYINAGVLTADEVAENRFGGDGFSYDTKIEMLNRENTTELENEELNNQMAEMEMQNKLQSGNVNPEIKKEEKLKE